MITSSKPIDHKIYYDDQARNWFKFHRKYLHMLRDESNAIVLAVVLSELKNIGGMDYDDGPDRHNKNQGWFRVSSRRLERLFMVAESTQTRWIKRLAELGLINTEQRGCPQRRWIQINHELIEQLCAATPYFAPDKPEVDDDDVDTDPARMRVMNPRLAGTDPARMRVTGTHGCGDRPRTDAGTYKEPSIKEPIRKKLNTVATSTSPADSSKLATVCEDSIPKKQSAKMEITKWDEKASDHFAMTLEKAGVKFKRTKRWNDEFRKLRNDWGKDDVRLVLEWYRDVIGTTKYIPEVYSVRSLRNKFQEQLLPKAKEWRTPRKEGTIVNGIQLLTAKDAEKIHETESDIGYCHDLVIHPDWYVDDFYADPASHYQLMADIINESIRADYGNAVSWRRHLREFGVGYLVKKHEG